MSGSESYQNIDKRRKFSNFIIDESISTTTTMKQNLVDINDHLDIVQFKIKFNGMIVGLGNYEYYMSDMLDYYSGTDSIYSNWKTNDYLVNYWSPTTIDVNDIIYRNNLSDFILNLIIDAVEKNFDTYFTTFYSSYSASNHNPNKNLQLNFLDDFKSFFSSSGKGKEKNLTDMTSASKIHFSTQDYKNIFQHMQNSNIFDLYYYVLEIEKIQDFGTNDQGIYFIKNFIGMNILKYFYLSEMLLKILLDTKENIESDTPSLNIQIDSSNNYTPVTDNYRRYNVIRHEFKYDTINTQVLVGMKLTSNIINRYNSTYTNDPSILDPEIAAVYKIIKDIYFINKFIETNTLILRNDNITYITNPTQLTDDKKIEIDNLNQNITDINKNIVELNLKNLNIEKNYEKNRNMYYVTLACVIIYIFLNIYVVWSGRTDSLLTLNVILIVVILLTKFFGLIKKSYQTLVKDLNN